MVTVWPDCTVVVIGEKDTDVLLAKSVAVIPPAEEFDELEAADELEDTDDELEDD